MSAPLSFQSPGFQMMGRGMGLPGAGRGRGVGQGLPGLGAGGGRARNKQGRGGGRPAAQNTLMGEWFREPLPQQDAPQETASSSGVGRGRNLVQPAWKQQSGLADIAPPGTAGAAPPPPPHIPSNGCNGSAHDWGVPSMGGSCGGEQSMGYPAPVDDAVSPWEAMESGPATSSRSQAAVLRSASSCSSDVPWGDLPGKRPIFGVEVEVPEGFRAPGPGPYLECQPRDLIFIERTVPGQNLAFATLGDREGWIDLDAVQTPHIKFPEFQVQILVPATPKRLGIAFCTVPGPIRGLAVALVLPDSMVHDYNLAMVETFPRSQLLEGDVITWAGGETEPEAMRKVLNSWRTQWPALRMRVNRMSLCRTVHRGAPAVPQDPAGRGAIPQILMYSDSPGLAAQPAPPPSPPIAPAPPLRAAVGGLSAFQ